MKIYTDINAPHNQQPDCDCDRACADRANEVRPEFVTDEHLRYLDVLRESVATNMFGAAPYLAKEFGIDLSVARKILTYWTKTFGVRHPV